MTSAQRAAIKSRRDTVKGYITQNWSVEKAFFGGSHARRTKLRAPADGKGDVDVYFVLDAGYRRAYGSGLVWSTPKRPSDLLDDIRRTLTQSLRAPTVRRDAPAVRINYSDMVVDVVPAFRRSDGRLDIPQGNGWLVATPEQQATAFTNLNAARAERLKPLIKMGKYWLSQHPSLPMRSYHLECLIYQAFLNSSIADYRVGVLTMFREAAWRAKSGVADPGGSGSDVAGYMSSTARASAAAILTNAAAKAQAAIDDPTYRGEINRWRALFGPRFPAYG